MELTFRTIKYHLFPDTPDSISIYRIVREEVNLLLDYYYNWLELEEDIDEYLECPWLYECFALFDSLEREPAFGLLDYPFKIERIQLVHADALCIAFVRSLER